MLAETPTFKSSTVVCWQQPIDWGFTSVCLMSNILLFKCIVFNLVITACRMGPVMSHWKQQQQNKQTNNKTTICQLSFFFDLGHPWFQNQWHCSPCLLACSFFHIFQLFVSLNEYHCSCTLVVKYCHLYAWNDVNYSLKAFVLKSHLESWTRLSSSFSFPLCFD